MLKLLLTDLVLVISLSHLNSTRGDEHVGIRVAEGFEVSQFADDDLAHDIYCMTIDGRGRVVVSGAGYVRILIDQDADGRADTFRQFVDGPATGAQGMFFDGPDLICTGDDGLIRYRDRNGDDRADGPAELLLKIKTGGEHHVHSIQKGPDGWWYLVAGNDAGVDSDYVTLDTSPIKRPRAGTLLRLTPDFFRSEILVDGFRNAYDFAFGLLDDIFVYDSDDEREVSLPWYRPTRVFQALTGSNAGWFSRSWKRPDYFFDMPPVLASLGRGSPTGVVCYRHMQFPPKYRNAVFVADWTYGRVIAFPLRSLGSVWQSTAVPFITATGQFGFAPTDLEVGPDGSLFVSVGGRGTRGGVYRMSWKGSEIAPHPVANDFSSTNLGRCLDAKQPLSSWSRSFWEPLAHELGREAFVQAALDQSLLPEHRMRAIEILTEKFGGLDTRTLEALARADARDVRARAAWSLGRTVPANLDVNLLQQFLQDDDPLVARCTLDAMLGANWDLDLSSLLPTLAEKLSSEDRFLRQVASRVVTRLDAEQAARLKELANQRGPHAMLAVALGRVIVDLESASTNLLIGAEIAIGEHPPEIRLEAVRLMQLALGDVGGPSTASELFDGYHGREQNDPRLDKESLDRTARRLAEVYPTGYAVLDVELSRLLAMLEPKDSQLLDRVLAQIDDSSHPTDDIHQLIVAACNRASRTAAQTDRIARAFLDLEPKILARKLHRDSNWDPRLGELFVRLVNRDSALPAVLVDQHDFGRPGHMVFLNEMRRDDRARGIEATVRTIRSDPNYSWTPEVVFAVAGSDRDDDRELVRAQFDNFALRDSVLTVLAEHPELQDRRKFVTGLESAQLEVLSACLNALAKLPPTTAAGEQVALVGLLRRLGQERGEYSLRERAARLLQRNLGHDFGFQFGRDGYHPQPDVIEQWWAFVSQLYPDEARARLNNDASDVSMLKQRLALVPWDVGDTGRGKRLFELRSCSQCHGNRRTLGPDLSGVARRFSRDDLFTAIVAPSRDIAPRYQTTLIETISGQAYSGLVVYESVDGLLLRNATNQTIRVESDEIEVRRPSNTSLMPAGLLNDLSDADWADLYAYLQSL